MEIVWPSAARALELFRGAKGDGSEGESHSIPLTHVQTERNKRSAEQPLDDSRFGNSAASLVTSYPYQPSIRQHQQSNASATHHSRNSFSHEHGNSVFTGDDDVYLPPPVSHSSHSNVPSLAGGPALVANSGYSWQSGDMNPHNYNTPLSTAVLPQLFSTGLVDDGVHAHHASSSSSSHSRIHSHTDQHPQSQSRRYAPPPQYFDYSSYPQMGPGYDIPESVQVSQPHPQTSQNPMFMSDQYSIYSKFLCGFSRVGSMKSDDRFFLC